MRIMLDDRLGHGYLPLLSVLDVALSALLDGGGGLTWGDAPSFEM